MKTPRAILFDNDGVLIASEALHWRAWETLLHELKVPYDPAEIRASVGSTAPRILAGILDRHVPGWSAREYDLDALAQRKNDHYLRLAQTELHAYPGVREGLEWLRKKGIATAVVSNAKRRELEMALTRLGLIGLFDAVVSRDDVRPPKPDPAPYLFAAACVGAEPADCLAIEDSPPGLESALLARIPAAAVATNFPREILGQPVPGRPDLKPVWIGGSMLEFFDWLKAEAPPEPQTLK
ncbi:MAG: HAD family phosphatase [Oligoflexia bacterium]|nr:HAD family phosphatase [Oligoflexia bacterium]